MYHKLLIIRASFNSTLFSGALIFELARFYSIVLVAFPFFWHWEANIRGATVLEGY